MSTKGESRALAIKQILCDHAWQTVRAFGLKVEECYKCGELKNPRKDED